MFQAKISQLDNENGNAKQEQSQSSTLAENESSLASSLVKNQPINDIKLAVLLLFDAHKLQTLKVIIYNFNTI